MLISFFSGLGVIIEAVRMMIPGVGATDEWTHLSGTGTNDVLMMTRRSINDPSRPTGIVLSASHKFWVPVSPKRVFDYLCDWNTRSQWDVLFHQGGVQNLSHVATGGEACNKVSVLRVIRPSDRNMLLLQASVFYPKCSSIIFAPMHYTALRRALGDADPAYPDMLPSGFAILPYGPRYGGRAGSHGSLVTIQFQILIDSDPTAVIPLASVSSVNLFIVSVVGRITASLSSVKP